MYNNLQMKRKNMGKKSKKIKNNQKTRSSISRGYLQFLAVMPLLILIILANTLFREGFIADNLKFIAFISPLAIIVIGLARKYSTFSRILVLFFLCAAFIFYQVVVSYPESQRKAYRRVQEEDRLLIANNTKPEITKEEAIELLKTCKVSYFRYTYQYEPLYIPTTYDDIQLPAPKASSTGVVLVKDEYGPDTISIADELIPELVPIAREAQKTCAVNGGYSTLRLTHDGGSEVYKEGKWYFKGEVVN